MPVQQTLAKNTFLCDNYLHQSQPANFNVVMFFHTLYTVHGIVKADSDADMA